MPAGRRRYLERNYIGAVDVLMFLGIGVGRCVGTKLRIALRRIDRADMGRSVMRPYMIRVGVNG
jgi:hypothetical protein